LMLTAGVGSPAFAQSPWGYRNRAFSRAYSNGYGYGYGAERQAEQVVRQAYRDILGREPDPSGLRQYTDAMVNRGWSSAEVRRSLLQSPEYQQRFGYNRYDANRYNRGWRSRY
jgi:uncharacterized protein DUF4214